METRSENESREQEQAEQKALESPVQEETRSRSHRDISGGEARQFDKTPDAREEKVGERDQRNKAGMKPYRDISGSHKARSEEDDKTTEVDQRQAEKTGARKSTTDQKKPMSDQEFEKLQRNRFVSPVDGVGFRFNKEEAAPGEISRFLRSLPEEKRESLNDPRTEMFIYVSSSRPGTEAYNQRLSEKRGENVKREFIEKYGVRAKITVIPLGERAARAKDKSPMSLNEPSDQDIEDRIDDPWDRTARIEIRAPALEMVSDDQLEKDINDAKEEVDQTPVHNMEKVALSMEIVAKGAEVLEKAGSLGYLAPAAVILDQLAFWKAFADAGEANRRAGVLTGIQLGFEAASRMTAKQLSGEIRAGDLERLIRRTDMLRYDWEDQLQKNPRAEHSLAGMREGLDVAARTINKDLRDAEAGFRSELKRQGLTPDQVEKMYQAHINEMRLQVILRRYKAILSEIKKIRPQ